MERLTLIITGKKKIPNIFSQCVYFVVFSDVIKYLKLQNSTVRFCFRIPFLILNET